MGKSKHRKDHKKKLQKYKANKKIEQEALKKKLMEQYMQMQKDSLASRESHTSTEEVHGPEIDIEELNKVEELQSNVDVDADIDIDVDSKSKTE